jgi:peroxiredoxin
MTDFSAAVPASPKEVCPLLLGSSIPAVTLRTAAGEGFDLSRAVKQRSTVLVFYRGGW